jgi:hypothetical protein
LVTNEIDLYAGVDGAAVRHGIATAAFAVLPNPGRDQGSGERGHGREAATGEALAPAGPRVVAHAPSPRSALALHDRLGLRVVDRERGIVEARLDDYVRNTFGALQGGVVAVIGEAAILAVAERPLIGLAVRYLSLGRVGPFRTEVDALPGGTGAVARATLRDEGAGGAIIAVATGRLAP